MSREGGESAVDIPDYLSRSGRADRVSWRARTSASTSARASASACRSLPGKRGEQRGAARRAQSRARASARIADVYAALPAITGKMELEYEGELRGAENIARELIRGAVGKVFTSHLEGANLQPVVQWFELGGELKVPENAPAAER